MKTDSHCCSGRPLIVARRCQAFTLTEVLVVSTLFILLLTGVLGSHIFGMRMQRIAETKLSATACARQALNHVRDEIRSAKSLCIGNGGVSSFTPIPDNVAHVGNALEIYTTTNTGNFVRYYLDTGEQCLKRVTSADPSPTVVANYVTNTVAFQAEDFRGNVLTNNQNNRVVRLMLEFYQWEYPIATVGEGGLYDYYRLQTRITRRTIE